MRPASSELETFYTTLGFARAFALTYLLVSKVAVSRAQAPPQWTQTQTRMTQRTAQSPRREPIRYRFFVSNCQRALRETPSKPNSDGRLPVSTRSLRSKTY